MVDAGRVLLCRCGTSANKPFCDSSHERAGFRSRPAETPRDRLDAETFRGIPSESAGSRSTHDPFGRVTARMDLKLGIFVVPDATKRLSSFERSIGPAAVAADPTRPARRSPHTTNKDGRPE
jgi:hypothetical protein